MLEMLERHIEIRIHQEIHPNPQTSAKRNPEAFSPLGSGPSFAPPQHPPSRPILVSCLPFHTQPGSAKDSEPNEAEERRPRKRPVNHVLHRPPLPPPRPAVKGPSAYTAPAPRLHLRNLGSRHATVAGVIDPNVDVTLSSLPLVSLADNLPAQPPQDWGPGPQASRRRILK